MSNKSLKTLSIQLNNFIHRIDCKTTIIQLCAQYHCNLKRIRRSKNWLLTGTPDQLMKLTDNLIDKKTLWIADTIKKALPNPAFNLTSLIQSHSTITVNQLMQKTGCTIVEARKAIDKAEGFA